MRLNSSQIASRCSRPIATIPSVCILSEGSSALRIMKSIAAATMRTISAALRPALKLPWARTTSIENASRRTLGGTASVPP